MFGASHSRGMNTRGQSDEGTAKIVMMSRRVLIVEDDAVSRQLLKRIVETEGHVAELAAGFHEAAALIDGQTYDLILLDLTLEDGDGLDLCRRVRARNQTPIM